MEAGGAGVAVMTHVQSPSGARSSACGREGCTCPGFVANCFQKAYCLNCIHTLHYHNHGDASPNYTSESPVRPFSQALSTSALPTKATPTPKSTTPSPFNSSSKKTATPTPLSVSAGTYLPPRRDSPCSPYSTPVANRNATPQHNTPSPPKKVHYEVEKIEQQLPQQQQQQQQTQPQASLSSDVKEGVSPENEGGPSLPASEETIKRTTATAQEEEHKEEVNKQQEEGQKGEEKEQPHPPPSSPSQEGGGTGIGVEVGIEAGGAGTNTTSASASPSVSPPKAGDERGGEGEGGGGRKRGKGTGREVLSSSSPMRRCTSLSLSKQRKQDTRRKGRGDEEDEEDEDGEEGEDEGRGGMDGNKKNNNIEENRRVGRRRSGDDAAQYRLLLGHGYGITGGKEVERLMEGMAVMLRSQMETQQQLALLTNTVQLLKSQVESSHLPSPSPNPSPTTNHTKEEGITVKDAEAEGKTKEDMSHEQTEKEGGGGGTEKKEEQQQKQQHNNGNSIRESHMLKRKLEEEKLINQVLTRKLVKTEVALRKAREELRQAAESTASENEENATSDEDGDDDNESEEEDNHPIHANHKVGASGDNNNNNIRIQHVASESNSDEDRKEEGYVGGRNRNDSDSDGSDSNYGSTDDEENEDDEEIHLIGEDEEEEEGGGYGGFLQQQGSMWEDEDIELSRVPSLEIPKWGTFIKTSQNEEDLARLIKVYQDKTAPPSSSSATTSKATAKATASLLRLPSSRSALFVRRHSAEFADTENGGGGGGGGGGYPLTSRRHTRSSENRTPSPTSYLLGDNPIPSPHSSAAKPKQRWTPIQQHKAHDKDKDASLRPNVMEPMRSRILLKEAGRALSNPVALDQPSTSTSGNHHTNHRSSQHGDDRGHTTGDAEEASVLVKELVELLVQERKAKEEALNALEKFKREAAASSSSSPAAATGGGGLPFITLTCPSGEDLKKPAPIPIVLDGITQEEQKAEN